MTHTQQLRVCGVLLISSVLLGACDRESRFPHPFYITSHPTFEVVNGPGRYVLESTCPSGRQLLGGGYYMPDGDNTLQIGVTANYPSAESTWRVVFENPDNGRANHVAGYILSATAYCLATPDYPIDTSIVMAQGGQEPGTTPFSIEAACPTGSVLTGGGFRTGVSGPSFATFNSNLFVSAPTMDSSGRADGWQVALAYLPQDTVPETTVYALCARQNLVAGPLVVDTLDLTTLPTGWGWSQTSASCPPNMFTTGGGYSIIGDLLIPRQVSSSGAQGQFSIWRNMAVFGFQTPNYDFRPCDPSANPDCAKSSAFAACIEVPNIPFVTVEILQPQDGQTFGPEGDTTETAPITFVAEAADENGSPLTGGSLQWFQDGIPFGTGESVTVTLPASQGSVHAIRIRVTATGATTSRSDEIEVFTGVIL